MPEIHLDAKKIKKEVHEIEIPCQRGMGTVSTSYYVSETIENLNNSIKFLQSALSLNPPNSELVYPTIDFLKETRNKIIHDSQIFFKANESDLACYEKTVEEYGRLINRPDVEEPEVQDFFEKNPILIDRGIEKIFSKKSFGGEEFPDFIAVLHNDTHILIEIEKPTDRMYTKRGHPSAKFSFAEQQIRDYLQWANEEKEFLRKRGLPNISVENTTGLVIIGMKKNLSPKEREKLAQQNFSSRSSHEIKTFDDILFENQQVINSIRKKNS